MQTDHLVDRNATKTLPVSIPCLHKLEDGSTCGEVFSCPNEWEEHFSRHLRLSLYSCAGCKGDFATLLTVLEHLEKCGLNAKLIVRRNVLLQYSTRRKLEELLAGKKAAMSESITHGVEEGHNTEGHRRNDEEEDECFPLEVSRRSGMRRSRSYSHGETSFISGSDRSNRAGNGKRSAEELGSNIRGKIHSGSDDEDNYDAPPIVEGKSSARCARSCCIHGKAPCMSYSGGSTRKTTGKRPAEEFMPKVRARARAENHEADLTRRQKTNMPDNVLVKGGRRKARNTSDEEGGECIPPLKVRRTSIVRRARSCSPGRAPFILGRNDRAKTPLRETEPRRCKSAIPRNETSMMSFAEWHRTAEIPVPESRSTAYHGASQGRITPSQEIFASTPRKSKRYIAYVRLCEDDSEDDSGDSVVVTDDDDRPDSSADQGRNWN